MSRHYQLGKVDRKFLERVVFRNLGARRSSLIVKPGHGLDNAVISLGRDQVMVATADPLSIIPVVGMERSAWLSVQLLASDFTTSGVEPQFAMLDFNLPPELENSMFERYLKGIHREFKRIGVAVAGGHTGKYPGCGLTIVGGGFLFGVAGKDDYITPAMAKDGDRVVVTKGAAIATTAILSHSFPRTVGRNLGPKSMREAMSYLSLCSTVKEARIASSLGTRSSITSLHDATEGGVMGGLYELASACGKSVVVVPAEIPVSEETRKVCELFRLDPLTSVSEGTLIITCRPAAVSKLIDRLAEKGSAPTEIGEVRRGVPSLLLRRGRALSRFVPPAEDPYWKAYSQANSEGWN